MAMNREARIDVFNGAIFRKEPTGMPKKPDWEVRMDTFEQRMYKMWEISEKQHLARMDRIDRRLDGITKLLQQGARIMVEIQASQR
jgi:hypothetical protein